MSVGETRILTDTRDNQDYAVTKVQNNTVWMTMNLAIGCNGSGKKKDQGRGLWWTATASTATSRYNLNWYTGHTSFGFAEGMARTVYGGYVRCIAN